MKRLLLCLIAITLIIALTPTVILAESPILNKVFYGGTNEVVPGTSIYTLSGEAMQTDNSVRGQMQFIYQYLPAGTISSYHGKVLYLLVEGNKAWIGGVITECISTFAQPGWGFVFQVQDSGSEDMISPLIMNSSPAYIWNLYVGNPLLDYDWINGNIIVN